MTLQWLVRKPEEVEERRRNNLQLHIFPGVSHNSQVGVRTFFRVHVADTPCFGSASFQHKI